ncbi:MAG: ATP-binding protein, partial [Candidatus Electryonea clarkiae]|nr:ATP-binding protein [Candidatus Electryonea clarkiae]
EIKNDSCFNISGSESLADIPVRSISSFGKDTLLLSCETQGLYLFNGSSAGVFNSQIQKFAKENFAISCVHLRDERYALATRFGGLAIFNKKGRILRIINQSDGLPDNNILGVPFLDRQGGLWLPLNYGLARIEALSPVEYYDFDLGIAGNVHSIIRFNDDLYMGASQGVRVLKPSTLPGRPASFQPLKGAENRCWMFKSVKNRLYMVSAQGLEEIVDAAKPPKLIHKMKMAYCLTVSPDSTRLFVGTYDDGVHSFKSKNNDWMYEGRIEGTANQVLLMESTRKGDLWLSAAYRYVQRVQLKLSDTGEIIDTEISSFDTSKGLPDISHYYPLILNDEVYFGNPAGLFRYNGDLDLFVPDSILGDDFGSGERGMWNLTPGTDGKVWFNSQFAKGACVSPGDEGNYKLNYPMLRISQSTFLSFFPEANGTIVWAGSEDGRLVRYNEAYDYPDTLKFHAIVRRVTVDQDSVLLDGSKPLSWASPQLPYKKNSIRFEYTLPRYDAPEAKKYQYRLIGLSDSWSEWTNETYKDFNSLHEGKYLFEVRGYDVYYFESEVGSFEFIILPPWYRTIWAYLLYIAGFVALVYLLLKWRFHRLEMQKRQLEIVVERRTTQLAEANKEISMYNEQLESMVSERTRQLVLSERQAVFGQLVQGIVHNLRNPLTASSVSTELIRLAVEKSQKKQFTDKDKEIAVLRKMADTISSSVSWIGQANKTLGDMITNLLTKSSSDKGADIKLVSINNLVQSELDFLDADRVFKHKVLKEINLSDEDFKVRVVPGELSQVFQNIVRNAIDAMHNQTNPTIKISTKCKDSEIVIRIADNGPGISEEIINNVFDPFFTTKPAAGDENANPNEPKGTGLGLWMSKQTLESYGGQIEVESETGQGTTFYLKLPVTPEEEVS